MISKKCALNTYRLFAARAPEYSPCANTPSYSIDISKKAQELAGDRDTKLPAERSMKN